MDIRFGKDGRMVTHSADSWRGRLEAAKQDPAIARQVAEMSRERAQVERDALTAAIAGMQERVDVLTAAIADYDAQLAE